MAGKSDLGVRTVSGIVMIAIAVGAFWLGEWAIRALVVAACLAMLWEWQNLVTKMPYRGAAQWLWRLAGVIYIGLAAWFLWRAPFLAVILPIVWAIDIFAYFAGRTFGGPKIAPSISPSKTWAGLFGGMIGAGLVIYTYAGILREFNRFEFDLNNTASSATDWMIIFVPDTRILLAALVGGVFAAVLAQSGDFFESWMKRRAGVKDSSNLIPGHGGVFDRLDGALPLIIAAGLWGAIY